MFRTSTTGLPFSPAIKLFFVLFIVVVIVDSFDAVAVLSIPFLSIFGERNFPLLATPNEILEIYSNIMLGHTHTHILTISSKYQRLLKNNLSFHIHKTLVVPQFDSVINNLKYYKYVYRGGECTECMHDSGRNNVPMHWHMHFKRAQRLWLFEWRIRI